MRKITPLILLFAFSVIAFAQQNEIERTRTSKHRITPQHTMPPGFLFGPSTTITSRFEIHTNRHITAPRQAMDSVYAELWDSQQGNWKVGNTQYFQYDAKGNNDHYLAFIYAAF